MGGGGRRRVEDGGWRRMEERSEVGARDEMRAEAR